VPEGRGPWLKGPSPRAAVGRAIVAARYGAEVPDQLPKRQNSPPRPKPERGI